MGDEEGGEEGKGGSRGRSVEQPQEKRKKERSKREREGRRMEDGGWRVEDGGES